MKYRINLDALAGLSEAEQRQALEQLQAFEHELAMNPLLAYDPWSAQRECHAAVGTEIRAFMGGNRAGKTTMGVCDDLLQVTPRELVPAELQPYKRFDCPCYIRICVPSGSLLQTIMVPKLREWTPKALLKDGNFDRSYSKFDRVIRLECGCRLDLMTYEQELDKFGGAALHRVHYDEEPPEDIRQECWARTLDFSGDELFTMTPLQGMTWMYDEIFLAAQREENAGRIHVTLASMLDNPYLPGDVRERIMAMWGDDDEMRQARVEGRFVHFGGLVYPGFEEVLVEPFKREEVADLELVCAIDPGVVHTGVVWVGFHDDYSMDVFAARKFRDVDVADVAEQIRMVNGAWGIEDGSLRYVIDPAARSRGQTDKIRVIDEYNNQGIGASPGQNDVDTGILSLRRRINHNKLRVGRDCEDLIFEARRYRIEDRKDGKFSVVKKDDHVVDALRYAAMERLYEPVVRPVQAPTYAPEVAQPPSQWRGQRRMSVQGQFV